MPKPFVGFQEGSLLSIRIWTKHIINAGSECIFLFITVRLEKYHSLFSILSGVGGGNSIYEGTGTCRSLCHFDPKNPEDTVAVCSPNIRMEN